MNVSDQLKLPFHDVYFTAEPLEVNEDLKALFRDSARFHSEEIARGAVLHFLDTARKYGFRLFFKAPIGFFNTSLAEPLNDGYATPNTHINYKGLPTFKSSEKFN